MRTSEGNQTALSYTGCFLKGWGQFAIVNNIAGGVFVKAAEYVDDFVWKAITPADLRYNERCVFTTTRYGVITITVTAS